MKNNDHCDFEFCRDCRLTRLNVLLLADMRRLSVVAVVFLYQITVFLQQNTTTSLLELYFNDSIQCKLCARGGGGGSQQRGRRFRDVRDNRLSSFAYPLLNVMPIYNVEQCQVLD